MKICVLSHARCRSSILVTSLANSYNLVNLQEDYDEAKKFSYKERQQISKSLDKKNETLNIYSDRLEKFTNKFFSENNDFVIKIWPRFFNATEFCYNIDSFIKNLEKTFNFSQYDKIILSNRDPLDAICSLSLAIKYGYNYNDKNLAILGTKRRYENIEHNKVELHSWNKSFLAEILLIDNIRHYFDRKNISYDFVPFTDVPSYVNNLPEPTTPKKWYLPIDTNIDYSKAVINYYEFKKELEDYTRSLIPVLNKIEF